MVLIKQVAPVVVFALAGSACYQGLDAQDFSDEITQQREAHPNAIQLNGIMWNGINFNGIKFNGIKFNGLELNGIKFNGIKFNGIKFNGTTFTDAHLEGSSIVVAKKWWGKTYELRDEQLVGMAIEIEVDVKTSKGVQTRADFVIRANDIYNDGAEDDVFYYDMEISLKGSNEWHPLCEGGVPAIPIANYWDETTGKRIDNEDVITFACTNGVLAHCVEWGYRPWASAKQCKDWKKGKSCDKVKLRDYHQACTRMARADYCGTGESWTVPGTPIDIYDHLSPQIEASETDWDIEAEWNPEGSYCLSDIRQQGWKQMGKYPKCNNGRAKVKSDCGSLKDHRALLGSLFEPVD